MEDNTDNNPPSTTPQTSPQTTVPTQTENIQQPDPRAIPSAVENNSKKKLKIFIAVFLILITVTSAVAGTVMYLDSKEQQNDQIQKQQSQEATDELITPSSELARICANEEKELAEDIDFMKGQVVLGFYQDLPPQDVKNFLKEHDLKELTSIGLNKPTGVIIRWSDEFESNNQITVSEVDDFVTQIRQEPYIENVEISTYWHDWPIPQDEREEKMKHVQEIDRWGYFILTFSDISKKDEFLQKYPQATWIYGGEPQGIFFRTINPNKATIMYKADNAMSILEQIKDSIGEGDVIELPSDHVKTSYEIIDGERVEQTETTDKYPVIYIHDRLKNEQDTGFVTALGVHFPISYYPDDIRKELAKYPEISVDEIKDPEYINTVAIEVPEGQEECWIKELEKEEEIEYASYNHLMEPLDQPQSPDKLLESEIEE